MKNTHRRQEWEEGSDTANQNILEVTKRIKTFYYRRNTHRRKEWEERRMSFKNHERILNVITKLTPTEERVGGKKRKYEIHEKKHPWRKEWEERKAFYGHDR